MKMTTEEERIDATNTLHYALSPFFLISRIFGVLPVNGVWPPNENIKQVNFKWLSTFVGVSLIIITFVISDIFLSARLVNHQGIKVYTIGSLSFSIICLFCFVQFFILARNWPSLIYVINQCDLLFLQKSYELPSSKYYKRTLRLWGSFLLVGAVVEHFNYIGSVLYKNHLTIKECNLPGNFWEYIFAHERNQFFSVIPFRLWITPFLLWFTFCMTFAWNYVDIFLTLICRGLEMRFKQFNWHISTQGTEDEEFWYKTRTDFLSLTNVLWECDAKLSGLILQSCTHNLYYLCSRIFEIFHRYRENFMDEIYFWFSLIFVLVRILSMMFAASAINKATIDIRATLYELPYWNVEMKRLNEVLSSDLIALSGKGFFYLKRTLIIGMVSTVIIYELVLLDRVDGSDKPKKNCTSYEM